ncbi:MAG: type I restriction-modification enzyme R subunit C-terminal domain-containing protein [Negativicutes bacterium]|jgi:type I restriction enzyme R subunit
MIHTSFWSADGKPLSAAEFLNNLYGTLPEFFKSEAELRELWSDPLTRKAFLERLADAGYGKSVLTELQKLINAEKSDIFDVLEYISYAVPPITREQRVAIARPRIFQSLGKEQAEFLDFVLTHYIATGVEEIGQEKLKDLLKLKYHTQIDAARVLGGSDKIRNLFISFQKHLYSKNVA